MRLSNLINSLPPYHFANAKQKILDRQAAGVDVISLSMGDPDLPAPAAVVERLCAAMQSTENHRYPEYRGMRALHEAIAAWFEQRFGVQLTPEHDILPLLGSKEGLAYAATSVLNAGDIALVPDPYYPVYISGTTTPGAEPFLLPLREEQQYLPDLGNIPADVLARTRLIWLNYPNNPTAACADRAFFERVVDFARRHDIVIIHDMAYAEVYFDDFRPMSILQIPGARDVAVELHSLSKTYNMAGFRIGMLVGNPELVDAVGRLKSNIDSGIFRPIQYAAIEALQLPPSWLAERNVIYQRRRDILVEGCNALGMRAEKTRAGLYVWAHVPQGYTSRDFANWLFDQTGVFVTPGTNFGPAAKAMYAFL
ncbi:aminotransferase class I/II-fold pyridoxal phosphate-dependent enzyme [Dictyobacter kobayashii]|uniref:Aminotransferase n=1 Tax=Dictyobacter kobayashii TaxID=2014872 RepID=A0A402AMQ6_9CHLR|nr:aminotransferase class I/II-fold pyridoxal phosphate-dependent enzyme [Dictyobacter kobayashii]GCE20417.1 LL-diaminopimelate aminotransferase [Dictyobacter kobayashii]